MGQTLNGSLDLSSTNGFTPGDCNQRGIGYSASQVDANKTQWVEWAALMRARGFDPNNYSSQLGATEKNVPTNVYQNPGVGMQAINAGKPVVTTKNPDGSTKTANGSIAGTSV